MAGGRGTRGSPPQDRSGAAAPAALSDHRRRSRSVWPWLSTAAGLAVLIAAVAGLVRLSGLLQHPPGEEERVKNASEALQGFVLGPSELPAGFALTDQHTDDNVEAAAKDPLGPQSGSRERFDRDGRLLSLEAEYRARDQNVFAQQGSPLFQVVVYTAIYRDESGPRSELEYRRQNLETLQRATAMALEAAPQFEQVRILVSPPPDVGEDRLSYHLEAKLRLEDALLTVLYEYILFRRENTLQLVVAASLGGPSVNARLLARILDEKAMASNRR
jgi:hypothetical protein